MSTSKYCQRKHRRFFIILFLFSFFVISQPTTVFAKLEQWSSEVVVSTNSSLLKYPCIAVNNRVLHVVWVTEYMNKSEIWYIRSFDNGNTWSAMKKLTMNSSLVDTPQIAVNGDVVHCIWKDFRTGNPEIFYKKSIDAGETWTIDQQITVNHSRSFDIYDLRLVAYQGSVHILWKDYRHGSSELYYKHSDDNGGSWGPDQRLTHDYTPSYAPSLAVYQQNVYVTWDNWGEHPEIWFMMSKDNGKTWSNTTVLSSKDPAKNSWIACSKDTLSVVWLEDHNGTWDIFYKSSVDGGASWSDAQQLTVHNKNCLMPKIMYSADTVTVFWQDLRNDRGVCMERHCDTMGLNWSEELLLTDMNISASDPNCVSSGHTQFLLWDYSSDTNQICYRKKSELSPIITDISIENTTRGTAQDIFIRVSGGDAAYNNSELSCQVEYQQSSGGSVPLEAICIDNHWESTVSLTRNGSYTIRAQIINPEGKESRWYTATFSVFLSDTTHKNVPGFELVLIVGSLVLLVGIYRVFFKGGKQ